MARTRFGYSDPSTGERDALRQMDECLRERAIERGRIPLTDAGPLLPLPVGPVPVGAGGAGPTQVTFTFAEGAFRIDAPGADAQEIASRLGGALAEEMRALAEEVDGNALA